MAIRKSSSRLARAGRGGGSTCRAWCRKYVEGAIGNTAQIGSTPYVARWSSTNWTICGCTSASSRRDWTCSRGERLAAMRFTSRRDEAQPQPLSTANPADTTDRLCAVDEFRCRPAEMTFAGQDHSERATHWSHEQLVGMGCRADNLHAARGQADQKHGVVRHQTPPHPHPRWRRNPRQRSHPSARTGTSARTSAALRRTPLSSSGGSRDTQDQGGGNDDDQPPNQAHPHRPPGARVVQCPTDGHDHSASTRSCTIFRSSGISATGAAGDRDRIMALMGRPVVATAARGADDARRPASNGSWHGRTVRRPTRGASCWPPSSTD